MDSTEGAIPPIDLVVFDMAGTTVYDGDAVHRSFALALNEAGLTPSRDEINSVMGISKPVAIRLLLESSGQAADAESVERIHADFVRRMIDYYETSPEVREIDGATEAMLALKRRGVKVALDTGFSRDIVAPILKRLGWRGGELIDATVCSDEVERGRPYPDMILRAMELTGVADMSRVAKVGDTPSDLYEGTDAGCRLVIGVTQGSHTLSELQRHPHTHLVRTVADIPDLILASRS